MCSEVSVGRESEERIRIGEAGSDRSGVEWTQYVARASLLKQRREPTAEFEPEGALSESEKAKPAQSPE